MITKSLEVQLGEARATMETMIAQGFGIETRQLQERRITALKNKIQRQAADNASVAASAGNLARELNINVWDLVKTMAKGSGPATRLSTRERAILRTVYGH